MTEINCIKIENLNKINDNYRVITGVNNATDLEYISSRHPTGARAGAPLTAYIKAVANFDSLF